MIGQLIKSVFSKPDITPTNVFADVFIIRGNGLIPKSHTVKHHSKMEQLRNKMIVISYLIIYASVFAKQYFTFAELPTRQWHTNNANISHVGISFD